MSRGRHPFDDEMFDDPFFRHFDDVRKHMDSMFSDFFKNEFPTIIIGDINDFNDNNNNPRSIQNGNDKPDLSLINPNISPNNNNNDNTNNTNNNYKRNNARDPLDRDPFRNFFRHFFEPELDNHTLSDINPNMSENNIITNDHGIIKSDPNTPGFRSPYLPNWNGAQRDGKKYYRSESVSIVMGSDGKTKKTTTVIDENGQKHTSTEEYDSKNNNGELNIFNMNPFRFDISPFNNNNTNNNNDADLNQIRNREYYGNNNKYSQKFGELKDKFKVYNPWYWVKDKWNNYNNGNNRSNYYETYNRNTNKNENNNDHGWRSQSYSKYKRDKHAKLDDIVKKD